MEHSADITLVCCYEVTVDVVFVRILVRLIPRIVCLEFFIEIVETVVGALRLTRPMIEKIRPKRAKPKHNPGRKQKTNVRIPNTRPAVAIPLPRFAGAACANTTGCV